MSNNLKDFDLNVKVKETAQTSGNADAQFFFTYTCWTLTPSTAPTATEVRDCTGVPCG
ncbi:hypothetical protein [Thermoflavimicrobium daqui]|uniref:hypothetical protein n=1 Tax=Thermoflavimicrobium daqui TaxID=2137476 RepID=UPI00143DE371|nr:hypothetical protein [Thermoflavimicrobium daqui]